VIIVIGGIIAALIACFSFQEPQPKYKGRALSYGLETYGTGEDQAQARKRFSIQNRRKRSGYPQILPDIDKSYEAVVTNGCNLPQRSPKA